MIVCICNRITEQEILDVLKEQEVNTVEELREKMQICNNCGMCYNWLEDLINVQ